MNSISVCFVCLGNICRSPSAEAVMRDLVERAKLADRIVIDSAGTGDWHIGEAPDERAQKAAKKRGYDLSKLRGRQVAAVDFARFALFIVMDDANAAALAAVCPPEHRDKIRLLMEFASRDDSRAWSSIPISAARKVSKKCSISARTPAKACSKPCARN